MIIEDRDIYAVQIVALHPSGKSLAGSCIPIDRRATTLFHKVTDEWKYTLGGKLEVINGVLEAPTAAGFRELQEEGYLLPKGARLYEVFRATKPFIPYNERRFFCYSVVVCDTPLLINNGDYLEKPNGIHPTELSIPEIAQLWESRDSTQIFLDICRRVLKGEKYIKPLNFKNSIWRF